MNVTLLSNFVLGSIGLALAVVLGQLLLLLWRRRPLASYRLVCALLFGGLLLPLAQVGMQRWQAPQELELVRRLVPVCSTLGRSVDESEEEPVLAPDPLADLSVAELETLLAALGDVPAYDVMPTELEALRSTPDHSSPGHALESADSPGPWLEEPAGEEVEPTLGAASAATRRSPIELGKALVVLYLGGLLVALVRLARRLLRTRRLLQRAVPAADPRVRAVWNELVAEAPSRARIRLLASPRVKAPVCFGLRRAAIVLPATPEPSFRSDVLRCVLLHELVHLERRDTWVMLAQELFHAAFWFHPAAWWLCRKLDALRELSCDLLVVQRTGKRKRYAQALLEYADAMARALPTPQTTALLPWSGPKSQLSRRIEMLVSLPSNRSFPWTSVPAAVSLVSCLWGGQLVVAAALSPAQDAEPLPAPVAEPRPPQEPAWFPEPRLPEPARLPSAAPAPHVPWPRATPPAALAPSAVRAPRIAQGVPPAVAPAPRAAARPMLPGLVQDPETPLVGVWLGDETNGLRVNRVMEGSLAERHQLQAGDVIVAINGKPASREEFERAKKKLKNGAMELALVRGERELFLVLNGNDWPKVSASQDYLLNTEQYNDLQRQRDAAAKQAGQNEILQARAALQRALVLNPDNDALRAALDALMTAQDAAAASRYDADRAEWLHAQEMQKRGDYAKALEAMRQLERRRAQDPEDSQARRKLAKEEALKNYQEALDQQRQAESDRRDAGRDEWRDVIGNGGNDAAQRWMQADRQAALESRLQATEAELKKRTEELEDLKARLRALEADARARRGTGYRSGGQLPAGGARAGSNGQGRQDVRPPGGGGSSGRASSGGGTSSGRGPSSAGGSARGVSIPESPATRIGGVQPSGPVLETGPVGADIARELAGLRAKGAADGPKAGGGK